MNEQWLSIQGYEEFYEVSNLGRVRRVRAAPGTYPGRILKNNPNGKYHLVHLSKNGICKSFLVHRLVAKQFVSNPDKLNVVHHIDRDTSNNHAINLEWTTCQKNTSDATQRGLMPKGESHGCSKLTAEQVKAIRLEYKRDKTSQWTLAEQYDVSQCQIWRIVHRKSWTHL